jgi:hypothetical protein
MTDRRSKASLAGRCASAGSAPCNARPYRTPGASPARTPDVYALPASDTRLVTWWGAARRPVTNLSWAKLVRPEVAVDGGQGLAEVVG